MGLMQRFKRRRVPADHLLCGGDFNEYLDKKEGVVYVDRLDWDMIQHALDLSKTCDLPIISAPGCAIKFFPKEGARRREGLKRLKRYRANANEYREFWEWYLPLHPYALEMEEEFDIDELF